MNAFEKCLTSDEIEISKTCTKTLKNANLKKMAIFLIFFLIDQENWTEILNDMISVTLVWIHSYCKMEKQVCKNYIFFENLKL